MGLRVRSDSLRVGAAGSAVAGLTALALAWREHDQSVDPAEPMEPRSPMRPATDPAPDPARHGVTATGLGGVRVRRVALVMSFISGLTSLGYQTLWTRLLSSGTGGSSYVFSSILVSLPAEGLIRSRGSPGRRFWSGC